MFKIFVFQPQKALQLIKEGLSKEAIFEKTGLTVGVNNASFNINQGEIFVIMGLSSSGKSTIVRMLNRLIEPTAGNVIVDGKNVTQMKPDELVKFRLHNMSMVFQSFAFFYTRAPNWTIFKLKPGKDVMWVNVPKIIPKESQKAAVDRMTVSGIEGAVTDPIKLGFVVSDIRIVTNKQFIKKNPAAKKFFEIFTIPLNDINEQNTRMNEGEKSQKDIERHVDEWIAKNQAKWDGWLDEARKAANLTGTKQ